jgi:hypothetical protein
MPDVLQIRLHREPRSEWGEIRELDCRLRARGCAGCDLQSLIPRSRARRRNRQTELVARPACDWCGEREAAPSVTADPIDPRIAEAELRECAQRRRASVLRRPDDAIGDDICAAAPAMLYGIPRRERVDEIGEASRIVPRADGDLSGVRSCEAAPDAKAGIAGRVPGIGTFENG